jgi:hypothetical protein
MSVRRLGLVLTLMTAVACSSNDSNDAATIQSERTTTTRETRDREVNGEPKPPACPRPGAAGGSRSARLERVGNGEPTVRAAVYPRPDYPAELWSQWGQGIVVDGRYISGLGDHCGANGNSFVYTLDSGGRLSLTGDVLSVVEHEPGAWGYGKLHAQMVTGPGGTVYATTYWGSREGLQYTDTYAGDLLLRIDPESGRIENLGVPIPGHGIPTLASSPEEGLIYGEAVDGTQKTDTGLFFVYDVAKRDVVFRMDVGYPKGFRSILVDGRGRAYFSTGAHILHVYDPDTGNATPHQARLPGVWLRAASAPAPDGTVYGVTREPDALFALEPSGHFRDLGPVRGYTASLALAPSGRLYYVPGAHGDGWKQGTPLISVDLRTGKDEVVVKLDEVIGPALGLRIGGSYNVVADPEHQRLLIGLNAGPRDGEETFGEIVLVEVAL